MNLKTLGVVLCQDKDHKRWNQLTNIEEINKELDNKIDNVKIVYLSDKHLNSPLTNLDEVLKKIRFFGSMKLKAIS